MSGSCRPTRPRNALRPPGDRRHGVHAAPPEVQCSRLGQSQRSRSPRRQAVGPGRRRHALSLRPGPPALPRTRRSASLERSARSPSCSSSTFLGVPAPDSSPTWSFSLWEVVSSLWARSSPPTRWLRWRQWRCWRSSCSLRGSSPLRRRPLRRPPCCFSCYRWPWPNRPQPSGRVWSVGGWPRLLYPGLHVDLAHPLARRPPPTPVGHLSAVSQLAAAPRRSSG